MKRKDTWKYEDDLILADIVLGYMKSGDTQTKAFEEAAKSLGRTSQACGFRWNSEVRKNYAKEIANIRSNKKRNQYVSVNSNVVSKNSVDELLQEVKLAAINLNEKIAELEHQMKVNATQEYQRLAEILDQAQNFVSQKIS
ncbi:RsfA family transcriptional regulator [Paenibacillus dendritiformis]|uniref:RsfA family transcriptional regulator n=1 Tax=Paenibacillus dendritiformis TaxID=130049 RepID=UPI00387E0E7D